MLYHRKTPRAQWYDYKSAGIYFVTICTQDRMHYFGKIYDGKMILTDIGKICEQELHYMLQKRPSINIPTYVIMPNHVHIILIVRNDCRDTGLPCPYIKNYMPCSYNHNSQFHSHNHDLIYFEDNNLHNSNDPKNHNLQNPVHNDIPTIRDKNDIFPMGNQKDTARGCPSRDHKPFANITNQSLWSIIGWRKCAVSRQCNKQWFSFARQTRYHDHIIRNQQEYERIKHYIQKNPENRSKDRFSK